MDAADCKTPERRRNDDRRQKEEKNRARADDSSTVESKAEPSFQTTTAGRACAMTSS
jgi:hypothetical protein